MAKGSRTVGMRKITKSIAVAGTAEPISATYLPVTDFEVYAPAGNTGTNFYIGNVDVDNTWIPRPKSTAINFVHGSGTFLGQDPSVGFDLNKIYIDVESNGDEVIIQYFAGDQHDLV